MVTRDAFWSLNVFEILSKKKQAKTASTCVATDLIKGRLDTGDQRASQSTATNKLEYKT